ncbi:MAG: SMP-30/gluconolactonase/LRE family protein [Pseudomonadota bacterium]
MREGRRTFSRERAGQLPQSVLAAVLLALSLAAQAAPETGVDILDDRARELVDEDATLGVLGEGYLWTEGPLWVEDGGYLLFSDIPNNVVHRYMPSEGVSVYLKPSGATGLHDGDSGQGANGLLLSPDGELVLMQQGDRRVAVMDAPLGSPAPRFRTLAAMLDGKRLNSPNDAVFHSDGSLYFTDPPYGLNGFMDDPGKALAFQGVYHLRKGGELELLDATLSLPNGIALSRDERTLYVAVSDEAAPRWMAYSVTDDGSLEDRRVFYDATDALREHEGLPDGMAVHSSGVLFATGPGGVWLFSPDGDVLARVYTGRKTANCALSSDERTLYMTAHDRVLALPLLKP